MFRRARSVSRRPSRTVFPRGMLGHDWVPDEINPILAAYMLLDSDLRPKLGDEDRYDLDTVVMGEEHQRALLACHEILSAVPGRGTVKDYRQPMPSSNVNTVAVICSLEPQRRFGLSYRSDCLRLVSNTIYSDRYGLKDNCEPYVSRMPHRVMAELTPWLIVACRIRHAVDTINKVAAQSVPIRVMAKWLHPVIREDGAAVEPAKTPLMQKWVDWIAERPDYEAFVEACELMKQVYPLYRIGHKQAKERMLQETMYLSSIDLITTKVAMELGSKYGVVEAP